MRIALLTAVLSLCLAACATPHQARVRTALDEHVSATQQHITDASVASADALYRTVDTPYIGGDPIALDPQASLPQLNRPITYGQGEGLLADAAHYIGQSAGISITLTPDAQAHTATASFPFPTTTAPLREVLDRICALTGTSWTEQGEAISIYRLATKTFAVEVTYTPIAQEGVITNASGLTQGAGQSSSGNGASAQSASTVTAASQQTTRVDYTLDVYADLSATLPAMLSPEGRVAVSPSAASVTVRDTQPVLDAIGDYIAGINERLNRQIEVEMTILSVDLSDADSFGIDWDLIKRGVGDATLSAGNVGNTLLEGGSLAATIVDTSNLYQGSRAIINALRQQVDTTVRRSTTFHAANNKPTRVQTIAERGYVANTTTTLVQDVGSQVSFQSAYQTTGFALTILPLIHDDGTISMQVQGSISAPTDGVEVSLGGDVSATIPNRTADDFMHLARLRSGTTMVLSTLDQATLSDTANGVGSARNWLFGGGRKSQEARRMLVVLLTPRVTR